jgi:alanine-glyoxylate transaminase/serine-glyoxylate transaminase/serine-pyruvate transaminase
MPLGRAARPPTSSKALRADTGHEIKAVLVTHNETATGVVSDVAACAAPWMPPATRRCCWSTA